jgi:hypothetical protein
VSGGAHSGALEAVERLINLGGEADDVLRQVVGVLHERLHRPVRIRFLEEGELVSGPAAGPEPVDVEAFPIHFQGAYVANLEVGLPLEEADRGLLARVATIVAPYALVGWDTGGRAWEP